jgi:hypothetical protein
VLGSRAGIPATGSGSPIARGGGAFAASAASAAASAASAPRFASPARGVGVGGGGGAAGVQQQRMGQGLATSPRIDGKEFFKQARCGCVLECVCLCVCPCVYGTHARCAHVVLHARRARAQPPHTTTHRPHPPTNCTCTRTHTQQGAPVVRAVQRLSGGHQGPQRGALQPRGHAGGSAGPVWRQQQ